MKKFLSALFLIGSLTLAYAQGGTVTQSGYVTPGHAAMWITNGVIGDGGTAASGNLTSLGVTASGPGICQDSGPISGAYNQICLGITQTGGGQISVNNYNGGSGGLTFSLNGTPFGLAAIQLPVTTNDVVCIFNTSGQLKDCGFSNNGPWLPLAGGTMTGTITGSDSGTWGTGGINGSIIGATTPEAATFTTEVINSTLTYGGVTLSASVTGTGSMVLSNTPTLTTPKLAGSSTGTTEFASANAGATNYTATFPANTGTLTETNFAQNWSALQTFGAVDLAVLGSSTGYTQIESANAGASDYVATLPANTGTLPELNLAQSWTAQQTFGAADLAVLGSSTGYTQIESANAGATNYVGTLPANTGAIAELNFVQTWTALQTHNNSDIALLGSSTGATTFTSANASSNNYTTTFPANTGTLSELNLAQSWSALQTFGAIDLAVLGSSTGYTNIESANAGASDYVATLPAATDTIAELTQTQTLTNKTLTSSTDVLGGVTMTLGSDATGDIYYRNSSGILTRLPIGTTGYVLTVSSGLPAWETAGGASSITVGSTAVNSGTSPYVLYNNGGTLGNEAIASIATTGVTAGYGLTGGGTVGVLSLSFAPCSPEKTVYTSSSGTYTVPTCQNEAPLYIDVTIVGGGGGGGGGGTSGGGTGGNGGGSCASLSGAACTSPVYEAGGGSGGLTTGSSGGDGGTVSGSGTCDNSVAGQNGMVGEYAYSAIGNDGVGGNGGNSTLAGAGVGVVAAAGVAAATNSGSGGGGGADSVSTTIYTGSGGGAGATCWKRLTSPASSYTYAVGAGGSGGTAGTDGYVGGAGAAGLIIFDARWQ